MRFDSHREDGQTIVEVLTALVILLIVIWPASSFFSRLLTTQNGALMTMAADIAEQEMETAFLNGEFDSFQKKLADEDIRLQKVVTEEGPLIRVEISVFQISTGRQLVVLRRYCSGVKERVSQE